MQFPVHDRESIERGIVAPDSVCPEFDPQPVDQEVVVHPDDRDVVRCYVRGCQHFVRRPMKRRRNQRLSLASYSKSSTVFATIKDRQDETLGDRGVPILLARDRFGGTTGIDLWWARHARGGHA